MRRFLPLLLIAATAACGQRPDSGTVVVSGIGDAPDRVDPSHGEMTPVDRLLLDATAQGLVRFDAAGQVEPGLAERWIVVDDGLGYIFRLREATWDDGSPVRAAEVVAILRRALRPGSRNALAPFLTAIDEVVEMTPEVIEIRLSRPRPDLLRLFAQPELAILRLRPPAGSGPLRIAAGDGLILRPAADPASINDDAAPVRLPENIRLRGETAARAVVRFQARRADLVDGGTFLDWPLVQRAEIAPANRRIDPAAGILGFAITRRDGFLAIPENRAALAAAIDRDTIAEAFGRTWRPETTLLPDQLDSARPPAAAGWLASQPASPAEQVRRWRTMDPEPVTIAVAMPDGPGATMLYGIVAANLRGIGIVTRRVAQNEPADLTLVDRVAPYDSARWYLATACRPCGPVAGQAIEAARLAPTLVERAERLAEADAALAADVAFVMIARPLRWSLVARRLGEWQPNPRAWHPLNRLHRHPD